MHHFGGLSGGNVGFVLHIGDFSRLLGNSLLHCGLLCFGLCGCFLHRFIRSGLRFDFLLHFGCSFDLIGNDLLHNGFFCGFLGCGILHGVLHGADLLLGLRSLGGGDGDVLGTVALHVADQGVAQLSGSLPAVSGIIGAGLGDDGGHLLVRTGGGHDGLTGGTALEPCLPLLLTGEGETAQIVDLIEHQAQGVGVHGGIQAGVGIGHLGGGIDAPVPVGQRSILQRIHGHKAQITDAVLLIAEQIDVLGLQIHILPAGFPADGHGGAQVDAQVQGTQMGHGIAVHIPLQSHAVAAEHMDLIAHARLHRLHLEAVAGDKAPLLGKGIQSLDLSADALGQLLIIGPDSLGITENAGQKQRIYLDLGGR